MKQLPKRKSPRLKNYDYSQNNAYFITICSQNKEHLFGNIVGAGSARPLETESTPLILSNYGKIIESYFTKINEHYPTTEVDIFVIMPNHVHFILILNNNGRAEIGRADPAPTIGNIIGWFKFATTKAINAPFKIWQRSYHDHIIRTYENYSKIYEYIQNNPLQWATDCHNINVGAGSARPLS